MNSVPTALGARAGLPGRVAGSIPPAPTRPHLPPRRGRQLTADLRECLQEGLHGRCSSSATSGRSGMPRSTGASAAKAARPRLQARWGRHFPHGRIFIFRTGLPPTITSGLSSRPHDPGLYTGTGLAGIEGGVEQSDCSRPACRLAAVTANGGSSAEMTRRAGETRRRPWSQRG